MLLTQQQRKLFNFNRDKFEGPRIAIQTDDFYIDASSITDFNFPLGLRETREKGQEIDHPNFVYDLYSQTLDLAPSGARIKGTYFRDAGGARFTVIADNNWNVTLFVKRSGAIGFSVYCRSYPEKVKLLLFSKITQFNKEILGINEVVKKANSIDLLIQPLIGNEIFDQDIVRIAQNFWKVVNHVARIDILANVVQGDGVFTITGDLIKKKKSVFRYYISVASTIYISVLFGQKHTLPRGGGDGTQTFDIFDEIIAIGATVEAMERINSCAENNTKGLYREHAVPCKVIVDKAIQMAKQPCTSVAEKILDIALMIRRNLTLVYCTPEEAVLLNQRYRSSMPNGWNSKDGNVLARFQEVNLPVRLFAYNLNPK